MIGLVFDGRIKVMGQTDQICWFILRLMTGYRFGWKHIFLREKRPFSHDCLRMTEHISYDIINKFDAPGTQVIKAE